MQQPTTNTQKVKKSDASSSLDVGCWAFPVGCCASDRRAKRAGLTLIEVMLALVILGIGLVALVTAAGRTIGVARQAKNFDAARELLARVEVEKPMMLEERVEDIAGSGTFDPPYSAFRWTRTVEPEGFEDDGLWRVETVILWTEDQRAKKERVVTLIYWPPEAEGGGGGG